MKIIILFLICILFLGCVGPVYKNVCLRDICIRVEIADSSLKRQQGLMFKRKIADDQGMLKVFVPTTPNPTTGFFVIVPHKDVVTTDLTVEEAFKMIISGGIVSPSDLGARLPVGRRCRHHLGDPDGR